MYITVFYLEKKFTEKQNEIIEKMMKNEKCSAVIHDCSYYIFFHKVEPSPQFLQRICDQLESTITKHSIYPQIMSKDEFLIMKKEIYQLQIVDFDQIINCIEFHFDNASGLVNVSVVREDLEIGQYNSL